MACHVSEGSGTEVPPAAEVPRGINLIVGAIRGRSDEKIPVEGIGNRVNLFRALETLRPDRTVCKGVDTRYVANLSVPNPFADLSYAFS